MRAHEFRDDDAGYRAWLASHPEGFVLNIARSHHPADAKLHLAHCWTIAPQARPGKTATRAYVKVCAAQLVDIDQWVIDHMLPPLPRCGTCHPTSVAATPTSPVRVNRRRARPPLPDGRALVAEPTAEHRAVQVWADDYIRYQNRPPWQQDLRNKIRALVPKLTPGFAQILHAELAVDKPDDADVENLLLYNIEAFGSAGRNGIRFELAAAAPTAADGTDYPVYYGYALQPLAANFRYWQPVGQLVSFDWTDLGAFSGEKKVAQVWLALKLSRAAVADGTLAANTPFAVAVEIRPPHGIRPRPDLAMKEIFDGVIAAFQAHTDLTVLPDVANRLATVLPCSAAHIAEHLQDDSRAVLGTVPQLVRPNNKAGVWNPGDHWCLAGELLPVEAVDTRWAIRGEIVEVRRRGSVR